MTLTRPLSPRESDIVAALGAGLTYAEVATQLRIARITVRKTALQAVKKMPRECQSPAGPLATIRRYKAMLDAKYGG